MLKERSSKISDRLWKAFAIADETTNESALYFDPFYNFKVLLECHKDVFAEIIVEQCDNVKGNVKEYIGDLEASIFYSKHKDVIEGRLAMLEKHITEMERRGEMSLKNYKVARTYCLCIPLHFKSKG